MMRVIGLFVTDLTRSTIVGPNPGSLESTSVTPASVTNTATLPPLNASIVATLAPVMMKRLSFTFSTFIASMVCFVGPGGACPDTAMESAPNATSTPSTSTRFIDRPSRQILYSGYADEHRAAWSPPVRRAVGQLAVAVPRRRRRGTARAARQPAPPDAVGLGTAHGSPVARRGRGRGFSRPDIDR